MVLAQSHHLTLEILQRASVWFKVVRKSCPDIKKKNVDPGKSSFDMKLEKVKPLITIMVMAEGRY